MTRPGSIGVDLRPRCVEGPKELGCLRGEQNLPLEEIPTLGEHLVEKILIGHANNSVRFSERIFH